MELSTKNGVQPMGFVSRQYARVLEGAEDHSEVNDNSMDSENSLGSDEDRPSRSLALMEEDEAGDLVGVSIGRAQSRMKAHGTPAEEKSRALEGSRSYFEIIPDATIRVEEYAPMISSEPEQISPELAADQDEEERLRGPTDVRRNGFTKSILKSGFPARPRAWSGDSISSLSLKRFLPDLTSLAKRTSLSSFMPNANAGRPQSQHVRTIESSIFPEQVAKIQSGNSPVSSGVNTPLGFGGMDTSTLKTIGKSTSAAPSYPKAPNRASPRPTLSTHRSSSDQSLYVRSLSRTSTLENLQYENVRSQVNSRFKAIKDSLQDSSVRLLSIPSFNLPDISYEWIPGRLLENSSQRKEVNGQGATLGLGPSRSPQSQMPLKTKPNTGHPVLGQAMSEMTGDIVIMGGYRGSILRSAKPPQRQLWVPMKVGLNIRKVDLEVGLNQIDEEKMEETIIPSGVLSHIGPVDICRRLMNQLRKCENSKNGELRVWDYGYDWRLSPHLLAQKLIAFLQNLPCNTQEKRGAIVIAHSLGGLITRHAVNQHPELFAGVLYAGVPQHCVNILGPMRNGDDVLLSSRVLTAQVNFTFRTSYVLLPEDGRCFIDKKTKENYPVDFFSADTWDQYRLSPCIAAPVPPLISEGRKSLIDFPNSLPSLPKIAIGRRVSTMLGVKEQQSADNTELKSTKEELFVESICLDNDSTAGSSKIPASGKPNRAASTDDLVGPTSASNSPPVSAIMVSSTIPRAEALEYLERTLKGVLRFKKELAFNSSHQSENLYPPFAVLYGKSVPTVYGAKVLSRDHIKHRGAYDDLAFSAGDGVCLAGAAMLPPGYKVIKNGLVKTDRGHVGLLGDLEAVGQCLLALLDGRRAGVGCGLSSSDNAKQC